MKKFFQEYGLGLIIAVFFLVFNLLTIGDYGITWDEPTHFNDGMKIISYLRGESKELRIQNFAYGQIPAVFSALSYSVFYGKLGLLPYDSALHLPNIIFGALAVFFIYFLGCKLFNKNVAFWSAIFLASYPRFIGMTHQNIKDLPVITFYCLTIYFFYLFFTKLTPFYGFWAGLFFGLVFNIKINAVFLPFIFIVWIVIISFFRKKEIRYNRDFFSSIFIFLVSSIVFIYVFRPAMWSNPIKNLAETYEFYKDVWRGGLVLYLGKLYKSGLNVPWHYAPVYFLLVTPIVMLFFFFLSIILLILKKDFLDNFLLILLWFFLPLSRYFSPKMIILDDIRHFVEIVPAACLIAGVGVYKTSQIFKKNRQKVNAFIFIFITIIFIRNIIKFHPYESVYFNHLIGGIAGASGKFDIDYWGFSLKEGSGWLNKNTALNSRIYVHSANIVAPVYLRADLKVTGKIDEANYLMIINRPSDFNETVKKYVDSEKPVYKIEKEGGTLLFIFKKE